MSLDLAALRAAVAANTDAVASAKHLIQDLAGKVEANKNDPAALQSLVDALNANDNDLAAAVVANTPASPADATETAPGTNPPAAAPGPQGDGSGT